MRINFRFSLRTLLAAVTAVCLLLGSFELWYRSKKENYRRQRVVIDRLYKANVGCNAISTAPAWMHTWASRNSILIWINELNCGPDTDINSVLDEVPNFPMLQYVYIDWRIALTDEQRDRIESLRLKFPKIYFGPD
jgi:hypothetical protein